MSGHVMFTMTRIINSLRLNLKIGGVSGFLPAVFTRRTAESDAWTLHRAISLGNNNSIDTKSESDSNTDGEMASSYPHENVTELAHEKSEEHFQEWNKYWNAVQMHITDGFVNLTTGVPYDWNDDVNTPSEEVKDKTAKDNRRWMFAMRHGERVDLTFGPWVNECFDKNGKYHRKDLNLPLNLAERPGGKESYERDTPLTRMGRIHAQLTGESLRLAGINVTHVYASSALRCVETAHSFLEGLKGDRSVKIRVDPGLFEYKTWYYPKRIPRFMTPIELHKAGLNVDLEYKPYVDLDMSTPETLDDYYKRAEMVMQSAVKDTEKEGGNVLFVGHAQTLDTMVIALKRLGMNKTEYPPYNLHHDLLRVPYCAFGAVRENPWEVVCPPCPPAIFSSGGRYNWRSLESIDV